MNNIPFELGALYDRRVDIHDVFNGQQRGGISTPASEPFVFIFTGVSGKAHGYADGWDESGIFHYFGEGKIGPMKLTKGNLAIARHVQDGKRLLLFRMLGKSKPYRFEGEFRALDFYEKPDTPDTEGNLRTAIVFRLEPIQNGTLVELTEEVSESEQSHSTSALRTVEIRTKQDLFRRRLIGFEKECRLSGVSDLRFVRASHMKPWAQSSASERTDGCNGLLLIPNADLLFDRGWISFSDDGHLIRSAQLPADIDKKFGFNLRHGRKCGAFNEKQRVYLAHHRDHIFEKKMGKKA